MKYRPVGMLAKYDSFGHPSFLDAQRMVCGKSILRIAQNGVIKEGEFTPPEATRPRTHSECREYGFLDSIHSVSPDRKWAASARYVFSAANGKVLRTLPFIARQQVFSRDGRSMFLYDRRAKAIYSLADWQANAALPPSGKVAQRPRDTGRPWDRLPSPGSDPVTRRSENRALGLEVVVSEDIKTKGIDVVFNSRLLSGAVREAFRPVFSGLMTTREREKLRGKGWLPTYRLTVRRSGAVEVGKSFYLSNYRSPHSGSFVKYWTLGPASKRVAVKASLTEIKDGRPGKPLFEFTIQEDDFPSKGVPLGPAGSAKAGSVCPYTQQDAHRRARDLLNSSRGLGSQIVSKLQSALVEVRSVSVRQVFKRGHARRAEVAVTVMNKSPWAVLELESACVAWRPAGLSSSRSSNRPTLLRCIGVVPPGVERTLVSTVEVVRFAGRGGRVMAIPDAGIRRLGFAPYRPLAALLKDVKTHLRYIGYYGPEAAAAAPQIAALLGGSSYSPASEALVRIGPEALPVVLNTIIDRTKPGAARERAMRVATRIMPTRYAEVRAALRTASTDPNAAVSTKAKACLKLYERAYRQGR
jgi:hypothetical protein